MSQTTSRRALVSVSDKTGLVPFAKGLAALGFEILSTGGTSKLLRESGVAVTDVAAYTGFPEMLDGRVKTLHPKVHGGLLGRPDLPEDAAKMREHGIHPIELVVVNLYPFEQTIAKSDVTVPEAIEQIDIGGPSMVRSSAKNHHYVAVVTRPSQYEAVLGHLQAGTMTAEYRRQLAAAAFEMTASYDRAIANYMAKITAESAGDTSAADGGDSSKFPETFSLNFRRQEVLRYGENPHQSAAFYVEPGADRSTLAGAEQLHGKELSYNNLLDLDAALSIAQAFIEPSAVVIKHNNPCGCGVADSLASAFDKAYAGDPVSAFGGIIGFNRPVDAATAELLCQPDRFIEAIIAPGYDADALEIITTRPKWKANVRLLACPPRGGSAIAGLDYRRVSGGLLVQDLDDQTDPVSEWKVVTNRQPTKQELVDLKFGWTVCRFVKSNAIVLAKDGGLIGVGAGQMSRVDSSFIASHKAGDRSRGAALASDAFFPFRDGVDTAAKAGVTAIIEPGGSRKDDEVIAACNEHNIAMIFTGRRHFRH